MTPQDSSLLKGMTELAPGVWKSRTRTVLVYKGITKTLTTWSSYYKLDPEVLRKLLFFKKLDINRAFARTRALSLRKTFRNTIGFPPREFFECIIEGFTNPQKVGDCVLWDGTTKSNSYPVITYQNAEGRFAIGVRKALCFLRQEVKNLSREYMIVAQSSCPRVCINPWHMTVYDSRSKALVAAIKPSIEGRKNPNSKMTPEALQFIRYWGSRGKTPMSLAEDLWEEFGLKYTTSHISKIKNGYYWKRN